MDSNAQPEKKKSYNELLMELMKLRGSDYDQFMEKMYEALVGEAQTALSSPDPIAEKRRALWTMINYFESKEHYEKCAELKKMADSLKD